jgi:hypothetical protein
MWDFLQSVLKDVVTTQSVKIAFYAVVFATAILTIFLLAWGIPFSEILSADGSAASSSIRHLAAIAYLPFMILVWFILYLQIHSERNDQYSGTVTAHPGAEAGARMDWPARVSRMA